LSYEGNKLGNVRTTYNGGAFAKFYLYPLNKKNYSTSVNETHFIQI